jgi:hypothetical protein
VSPKVVSDRIGHANVGFFLQTFAHALKNDDREAAEQAASLLLGSAWGGDSQDGFEDMARHENGPGDLISEGRFI